MPLSGSVQPTTLSVSVRSEVTLNQANVVFSNLIFLGNAIVVPQSIKVLSDRLAVTGRCL